MAILRELAIKEKSKSKVNQFLYRFWGLQIL